MMTCPECGGGGGSFEDFADSFGEHSTRDVECEACEGTGEVPARCDCGNPGEHAEPEAPTGFICGPCKADAEAP